MITCNKQKIAKSFSSFFVIIGPNLAKSIPNGQKDNNFYLQNKNIHSIFVSDVTESEVISIIKSLKSNSPGWDSIAGTVLKSCYNAFITPLTYIMNLSISKGVVPKELKLAKVVPLFKSGDTMAMTNYRPVSILPVFSKVLEKLMYKRLLCFLNKYKILYDYQFGFRNKHSPELALTILIDKISNALNNGDHILGIFLDFSKAFDTINHDDSNMFISGKNCDKLIL